MRLVPPEVSLRTPSAAERAIFKLLRLADVERCSAIHSLNLSEHQYKIVSEIDFLLVGPPGLFVLEVKGGRVARRDGVWTFTDRFGKERRKAEGPFDQAKSAAFSLRDRIRRMAPYNAFPDLPIGWAVVFPDQPFDEPSVEWAPEMVLDGDDCRTAATLEAALRRMIRYWRAKSASKETLTADQVTMLHRLLRPDFDLVPSLRVRGERLDLDLQSLTENQYKALDYVGTNDRILCEGGAGTGKTFLAAEVARRESVAGRRVLLTCRSPILARFLAQQPGLSAGGCSTAPLATVRAGEPFDSLVVDEGQDLMNLEDLIRLDGLLRGGLEAGRWRVFYDSNNQSGVLGVFDPDALAVLTDTLPTRLHLTDNCRNTRDIVGQVQLIIGADVGVSTAGAGPPVEFEFWSTREGAAEQLAGHLAALFEDGVEPRHISVLSPTAVEDSCVSLLPARLRRRISVLDASTVVTPVDGVGFSSIRDYKGLENRFVCVVDITTVDGPEALNTLYVAMTRPRAGLWIGLHEDVRSELGRPRGGPKRARGGGQ